MSNFFSGMTATNFYAAFEAAFARNVTNGWGRAFGAEVEGQLHCPNDPMPALAGPEFLAAMPENLKAMFAAEVHLGRIELLTHPAQSVEGMMQEISTRLQQTDALAASMGLEFRCDPVVPLPEDHFSVVLPELRTSERFQRLTPQQARAALAIAGLQFQRGAASWEQALAMYEAVRLRRHEFIAIADTSRGERQQLYTDWAGSELATPPILSSKEDVWRHAQRFGWAANPKGWWSFLRINAVHGTVEIRCLDATRDMELIHRLAQLWAEVTDPFVG